MKVCTLCDAELPFEAFAANAGAKDGFSTRCRTCMVKVATAWRAANRDRSRANARAAYDRRTGAA